MLIIKIFVIIMLFVATYRMSGFIFDNLNDNDEE